MPMSGERNVATEATQRRRWRTFSEGWRGSTEVAWSGKGSVTEGRGRGIRSPSPPRYLPVAPLEERQPTSDKQGTGAQPQQRGADGDTTGLRQVFLFLLRHAFLLG